MFEKVFGSAVFGIDATTITVEVHMDNGIGYHLVGLPDNAVKESCYRIASALKNTGFQMPGKKITINMAPADLKKEGASYDLTIAIGILLASGQIKSELLKSHIVMGELSLDGHLQPIRGILPIAIQAKKEGFQGIFLPERNAREASVVDGLNVFPVNHLSTLTDHLIGKRSIEPIPEYPLEMNDDTSFSSLDFNEVKGQEMVKRCLEIAAAGGHNILMIGPPGSGKTMLAKRLPGILPMLTREEALETTKIHSVAGKLKDQGLLRHRPFRNPHHSASAASLVGGGNYPHPGEISMAHNGILFLDELPEFRRDVLEVLRQPLEDREITINRARFTVTYPSSVMLVASMNPSPSGQFTEFSGGGSVSENEARRYLNKISGPLLDRIDMHIEVYPVPFEKLTIQPKGESSLEIRKRVEKARYLQNLRFRENPRIHYNAQMDSKLLNRHCQLDLTSQTLLKTAMERLNLSARAYDRILKVARTIADLENQENLLPSHLAEAIQYRSLDRELWK